MKTRALRRILLLAAALLGAAGVSACGNSSSTGSSPPQRPSGTTTETAEVRSDDTPRPSSSPVVPSGSPVVLATPERTENGHRVTAGRQSCGHQLGQDIFEKWISLGGESGFLGCAVTGETVAPHSPQGTTGRWARFGGGDGGYIVRHETGAFAGHAFEVHGCMFKLYSNLGGTGSWLGFPISDEYDTPGGRRSDFEGGDIVWDRRTGVCQARRE